MRSIRFWATVWLLLAACGFAFGEETLDELFEQAHDTVVSELGSSRTVGLVRPVFLYFGNLETQGVATNGWKDIGQITTMSPSIWYFLHLKAGIDVQPIPEARLIGTFSTYLPQGLDSNIITSLRTGNSQSSVTTVTTDSVDTSATVSLDDLYLDYTILDSASFRIGKFNETWGQGRLFNPGNLVTATSGGVNLKGFAAWGPITTTGIIVGNTGYFESLSHPRPDELAYAGSVGFSAGNFTGGVSGFHQKKSGQTIDLYLRSSLLGFDVYGEALGYHAPQDGWWPGFFLGTFREFTLGTRWRVIGEYWLDGSSHDMSKSSVGLGAASDSLVSELGLKLNARWLHSLRDSSGQLLVGFVFSPLPKMDIGVGVPWTYGSPTSEYVTGNSDPDKRVLAGVFTVTVKFDFQKEW